MMLTDKLTGSTKVWAGNVQSMGVFRNTWKPLVFWDAFYMHDGIKLQILQML